MQVKVLLLESMSMNLVDCLGSPHRAFVLASWQKQRALLNSFPWEIVSLISYPDWDSEGKERNVPAGTLQMA